MDAPAPSSCSASATCAILPANQLPATSAAASLDEDEALARRIQVQLNSSKPLTRHGFRNEWHEVAVADTKAPASGEVTLSPADECTDPQSGRHTNSTAAIVPDQAGLKQDAGSAHVMMCTGGEEVNCSSLRSVHVAPLESRGLQLCQPAAAGNHAAGAGHTLLMYPGRLLSTFAGEAGAAAGVPLTCTEASCSTQLEHAGAISPITNSSPTAASAPEAWHSHNHIPPGSSGRTPGAAHLLAACPLTDAQPSDMQLGFCDDQNVHHQHYDYGAHVAAMEAHGEPTAGTRHRGSSGNPSGQAQTSAHAGRSTALQAAPGTSGKPAQAGPDAAWKVPKLPMVRLNRRWYRARVLQDVPGKVYLEYPGLSPVLYPPAWVSKEDARIWRGSSKGKDWRYLGDGAWEPRDHAVRKHERAIQQRRARALAALLGGASTSQHTGRRRRSSPAAPTDEEGRSDNDTEEGEGDEKEEEGQQTLGLQHVQQGCADPKIKAEEYPPADLDTELAQADARAHNIGCVLSPEKAATRMLRSHASNATGSGIAMGGAPLSPKASPVSQPAPAANASAAFIACQPAATQPAAKRRRLGAPTGATLAASSSTAQGETTAMQMPAAALPALQPQVQPPEILSSNQGSVLPGVCLPIVPVSGDAPVRDMRSQQRVTEEAQPVLLAHAQGTEGTSSADEPVLPRAPIAARRSASLPLTHGSPPRLPPLGLASMQQRAAVADSSQPLWQQLGKAQSEHHYQSRKPVFLAHMTGHQGSFGGYGGGRIRASKVSPNDIASDGHNPDMAAIGFTAGPGKGMPQAHGRSRRKGRPVRARVDGESPCDSDTDTIIPAELRAYYQLSPPATAPCGSAGDVSDCTNGVAGALAAAAAAAAAAAGDVTHGSIAGEGMGKCIGTGNWQEYGPIPQTGMAHTASSSQPLALFHVAGHSHSSKLGKARGGASSADDEWVPHAGRTSQRRGAGAKRSASTAARGITHAWPDADGRVSSDGDGRDANERAAIPAGLAGLLEAALPGSITGLGLSTSGNASSRVQYMNTTASTAHAAGTMSSASDHTRDISNDHGIAEQPSIFPDQAAVLASHPTWQQADAVAGLDKGDASPLTNASAEVFGGKAVPLPGTPRAKRRALLPSGNGLTAAAPPRLPALSTAHSTLGIPLPGHIMDTRVGALQGHQAAPAAAGAVTQASRIGSAVAGWPHGSGLLSYVQKHSHLYHNSSLQPTLMPVQQQQEQTSRLSPATPALPGFRTCNNSSNISSGSSGGANAAALDPLLSVLPSTSHVQRLIAARASAAAAGNAVPTEPALSPVAAGPYTGSTVAGLGSLLGWQPVGHVPLFK